MRIGNRLLLLALAVLTFSSAPSRAEEGKASLSYDWAIKAEYPTFDSQAVNKLVQEWMNDHVEAYLADGVTMVSADPEFPTGSWEADIDYELSKVSDRYASVVFSTFVSPYGAAHPMRYLDVLNLDLAKGSQLSLEDLFADPDKAVAIMSEQTPSLLIEYLRDSHPGSFPEDSDKTFFFEEGWTPDRENYDLLGLEPGGVRVYFQLYQVVPYAFGMPNILVPLEQLKPAGPNKEIWPEE